MFENAAAVGDAQQLLALLTAGVDVDHVNLFGQTALDLALYYGHREAQELLESWNAMRSPQRSIPTPVVRSPNCQALPGDSWLLEPSLSERDLKRLDCLAESLPVPEMEVRLITHHTIREGYLHGTRDHIYALLPSF